MRVHKSVFFAALFLFIVFIFRNTFSIEFFSDDFFFLKISRIDSMGDFLNFFNPTKGFFYRPLTTEVFYALIHLLSENIFLTKLIVLGVYIVGLVFMYLSIKEISKNNSLAGLATFLYGIHFSHVFQLYWLATFQEVGLMTTLAGSFYFFSKGRYTKSLIFYLLALLSKETALMYPLFLLFYIYLQRHTNKKELIKQLIFFIILGGIFFSIYKNNLSAVSSIDTYNIQLSPKLILNNTIWYLLWSAGFANFLPIYFTSLLSKPLPTFWELFKIQEFRIYFPLFLLYLSLFAGAFFAYLVKKPIEIKKTFLFGLACLICFMFFLLPALPIVHRWMVRLTIPLLFVSLFQAYLLILLWNEKRALRALSAGIIYLYVMWNFYAIGLHENSSLYLLESRFVKQTNIYFAENKDKIATQPTFYLEDRPRRFGNPWGGSEKLKTTYHDQDFLDHYLPKTTMNALYGFEIYACPKDAHMVKSTRILEGH